MELVVIDTKANRHLYYKDGKKITSIEFTRILDTEEVEEFRTDPQKFLCEVEEIEDGAA